MWIREGLGSSDGGNPYDGVVIHYSEIALKGENRGMFEAALEEAARVALSDVEGAVRRLSGRLLATVPSDRVEGAVDRLRTVFGISWIAPCAVAKLEMEEIRKRAIDVAKTCASSGAASFKVESSRDNKEFPLRSLQMNQELGRAIVEALGLKVNLEEPDMRIIVEVLREGALVCCNKIRGPGGLPVGTTGRALALLSGGIDSPVAAWMTARRGVEVDLLHLYPYDHFEESKLDKIVRLARTLSLYAGSTKLNVVPCWPVRIRLGRREGRYAPLLFRLFSLRLAARIARERGHLAIVTGDSVGQVASQTLHNISATYSNVGYTVIAPLVGMDKEDIVRLARSIGTYEISIEPYPDCCPALVRGHVATWVTGERLRELYEGADLDSGVDEALLEGVEMDFERRGADVMRSAPRAM
ncbi:MAG: tRNA uracil 4-sulfurtransferase ThiI [Conexivisphaera sp.]